ncbi:MAG: hypothetical protein ABIU10_03060 [Sphingomicrobium sp.]
MHLLNRSGLAAIAVATALISTPALGQETTPVTSDPAPIVADEPLTVEPLPTPASPPEAADTLAPVVTAPATRTARPTRATAVPVTRVPVPAARTTAPAASSAPAVSAAPTSDAVPPVDPVMVAPLPEPVAAAPVAPTSDSVIDEDLLPIAGAAGLGILALAGAGFALRRRRRNNEQAMVEDSWEEPAMSRPAPVVSAKPIAATAPVMATAPVATSAFGWDKQRETAKPLDRIESAKRGPSPDNPSLSLKKRLKRAAFFDQRDRQIAAGMGTPVSATAGLPDGLISQAPMPNEPARRPTQGLSMSFGKTFQPA